MSSGGDGKGVPAGLDVTGVGNAEKDKLLHMEDALAEVVVGQPEALRVVSDAVRVARAGLQPSERPLGVFMLLFICSCSR